MPSFLPIAGVIATLAAIEGLSWWWMNPPAAGSGETVLAYRPGIVDDGSRIEDRGSRIEDRGSKIEDQSIPAASPNHQSTIHNPQSSISPSSTDNRQPTTDHSSIPPSPSTLNSRLSTYSTTPLPEIYRQAAPMLRCSTGEVFRIDTPDDLTLHLAWFEWNDTDTGSVLEAFRHMPEACMGSLGLKLVSKEKPIAYTLGLDRDGAEIVDRGSEIVDDPAPSSDQKSSIINQQSSISPSYSSHAFGDKSAGSVNPALPSPNPRSTISLLFDHTIFTDPASAMPGLHPRIHSFRAVWVSGMESADARRGIDGLEFERLRTIRLKAAATRYRPTHARVIQGTVRGALNAEAAWQAFEHHMLRHLTFAR